ncbi:MAG: hypothetical protein JNL48_12880 [Acidobacteria bacterium]|nr:hypothetical protein [Acidobacteriota bacterium]
MSTPSARPLTSAIIAALASSCGDGVTNPPARGAEGSVVVTIPAIVWPIASHR